MKKVVIIHESQLPEGHPYNHMGISLPESGWRAIHKTKDTDLTGLWDLSEIMLKFNEVEGDYEEEVYNVFDPEASAVRISQAFETVQGGGDPAIVICSMQELKAMLDSEAYLAMYPKPEVDL